MTTSTNANRSVASFFGNNESDIMSQFGVSAPKKEETKPAPSMMKPTGPAPAPKMGAKFLTSVEDIMAEFGIKPKKQKETIDDLVAEFGNSNAPAPAPAVEPFKAGSAMNELVEDLEKKPETSQAALSGVYRRE